MAVDVGDGLFITPDVIDEEDESRIIELACTLKPTDSKGYVGHGTLMHPTAEAFANIGWNGCTNWTPEQYCDRFPDWLVALWWKLVGRGVVPIQVANILPDQVSRGADP